MTQESTHKHYNTIIKKINYILKINKFMEIKVVEKNCASLVAQSLKLFSL